MTRRDFLALVTDTIERDIDATPSATTEANGPPNDQEKRQIIAAVNAANEQIIEEANRDYFKRPKGGVIRTATTVTLDVTEYSETFANLTGSASWMNGCSIEIDGDTRLNRIYTDGGLMLAYPYMGSTGTGKTATVYCDSIELASDALKVLGPVELDHRYRLTPLPNEVVPLFEFGDWWDYDFWESNVREYGVSHLGKTDRPLYYHVATERIPHATDNVTKKFIRFRSLPNVGGLLSWQEEFTLPEWDTDAFTSGHGDASIDVYCPEDKVNSILFPMAVQKMTKWFRFEVLANATTAQSENILTQIYQDYQEALAMLRGLRPSPPQSRRLRLVR